MNILQRIDGHKTHIAIVIAVVLVALQELSLITPEIFDLVIKLDGLFGAYAVRDAIRKIGQ